MGCRPASYKIGRCPLDAQWRVAGFGWQRRSALRLCADPAKAQAGAFIQAAPASCACRRQSRAFEGCASSLISAWLDELRDAAVLPTALFDAIEDFFGCHPLVKVTLKPTSRRYYQNGLDALRRHLISPSPTFVTLDAESERMATDLF